FRFAGVNSTSGIFEFFNKENERTSDPIEPQGGDFNDYVVIGNSDPKFFGGIQSTFRFKRFRLNVLIEFKKQMGRNFLSQVYAITPGGMANLPRAMDNRWRKPGDEASFQKVSTNY